MPKAGSRTRIACRARSGCRTQPSIAISTSFVQAQYELSEQAQHALFDLGFDVDMSYSLVNGVAARKAVNTARGVSPP